MIARPPGTAVRDDFAGPGGWDVALAALGITDAVGVELDGAAVATGREAGHTRIRMDVMALPSDALGRLWLYVASPPCQTWSPAGKGTGRAALPHVLLAMSLVAAGMSPTEAVDAVHDTGLDIRTVLVLHPLAVIRDALPTYVALEQVRTVLPVWLAYAEHLRAWGYSVDVGVLSAEEYGVPQTRARAILVARRDGVEARLPAPTHSPFRKGKPQQVGDLLPWRSMLDALGPEYADRFVRSNYGTGGDPAARGEREVTEPSATITSKFGRNRWLYRASNQAHAARRELTEPAPTVMFGRRSNKVEWMPAELAQDPKASGVRVSVQEGALLQSFPAGYPWQGGQSEQYLQVGNAVPPLLAEAILRSLLCTP